MVSGLSRRGTGYPVHARPQPGVLCRLETTGPPRRSTAPKPPGRPPLAGYPARRTGTNHCAVSRQAGRACRRLAPVSDPRPDATAGLGGLCSLPGKLANARAEPGQPHHRTGICGRAAGHYLPAVAHRSPNVRQRTSNERIGDGHSDRNKTNRSGLRPGPDRSVAAADRPARRTPPAA